MPTRNPRNPRKRVLIPGALRPRLMQPTSTAHVAITTLWATMEARSLAVRHVARKAGVDDKSMRNWRSGTSARIADLEACLNVMGLGLRVVPLQDKC